MLNIFATRPLLIKRVRRGWREQRGSQGLQAAAVAVIAAVIVVALMHSFGAQVQPAVQRAMECASAALSGLAGCPSHNAALQQAVDQASAALGQQGGPLTITGAATAPGAAGAAAPGAAGNTATSGQPNWWDHVTHWFGQQWDDAKELAGHLWGWLRQAAVIVGLIIGGIVATIAAAVAFVVGAPVLLVAGIVGGIAAIIGGTVYANKQHGLPWSTHLLKHLGMGLAAALVAAVGWVLEAGAAALAGATAALVAVTVALTALLNKLTGQRWDKGLLANLALALVLAGGGAALRGAHPAAEPPPVAQAAEDAAQAPKAADEAAHPAVPCSGLLAPRGKAPGLGAPQLNAPCRNYVPSTKHDEARGWGTPMDLDDVTAADVLNNGIAGPKKQVYGYHDGKIYVFQPDNAGGYHGYPAVNPGDVPTIVLREMLQKGWLTKAQYRHLIREVGR